MTQNDTPSENARKLTPVQVRVLAGLLTGHTVTAAAADAGISCETVHRWLRKDYGFQAAFNCGQSEIVQEMKAVLLSTALAAAEIVGDAVQSGDVRVALAVLKGVGGLTGCSLQIGPDDEKELQREAELVRHKREHSHLMRSIGLT